MDYEYACLTLVYMNCYLDDVLMTVQIILFKLCFLDDPDALSC